jgi:hypothetical protein
MNKINISEQELQYFYLDCFESTSTISNRYRCSEETIRNKLKEYKIRRRKGNIRLKTTVKVPDDLTKISYLAGIVDGEGTIAFAYSEKAADKKRPRLSVKNTDLELMQWISKYFGGKYYGNQPKNEGYKYVYRWSIDGVANIAFLLDAIRPYLIIKRKNCDNLLKYCNEKIEQTKNNIGSKS